LQKKIQSQIVGKTVPYADEKVGYLRFSGCFKILYITMKRKKTKKANPNQ
jgi:hypothetical protein